MHIEHCVCVCVCVCNFWNWTCFSLVGHTSSKNRNQFCILSPPLLISLFLAPFFKNASTRLTFCSWLAYFVHIPLPLLLCRPDVCRNRAPWIFSPDRACGGWLSQCWSNGPSIYHVNRQPSVSASVPQLRWGESCLSAAQLSLTSGANSLPASPHTSRCISLPVFQVSPSAALHSRVCLLPLLLFFFFCNVPKKSLFQSHNPLHAH